MPLERTMSSAWFLGSTALCCGLSVAFTTWVTHDSPGSLRVLAALIGLGASLALMLLVAWALTEDMTAVPAGVVESVTTQSTPVVTAATPPAPNAARDEIAQRLDEGLALREEVVSTGASDPRVDAWIHRVRDTLLRYKPGVLGYVDALSQRPYADESARLRAYVGRLQVVVRDLV